MSLLRRLDGPRGAPIAVLLAGVASAVGGARAGVEGAPLAGLLAAIIVVLFFWAGALPLLLVGGDTSLAGIGFVLLMTTYVLRVVGLAIALTVASRSDAVDIRWLALSIIGCTLVWVVTQVALVGRSRATL